MKVNMFLVIVVAFFSTSLAGCAPARPAPMVIEGRPVPNPPPATRDRGSTHRRDLERYWNELMIGVGEQNEATRRRIDEINRRHSEEDYSR